MEVKSFLSILLVFVGFTFTMNVHAQQISYQWSTSDTTANFLSNIAKHRTQKKIIETIGFETKIFLHENGGNE